MDRLTKVTLISVLWLLILQYFFGFFPAALGSWSAGIDLQRYTIQIKGQLGPTFADTQQSIWFAQANADPVYGIFFAFDAIVGGFDALAPTLVFLKVLPPTLLVVTAGALASARQIARLLPQSRYAMLKPLLPLLFTFPLSRTHVLLLGYSGSALASAVLLLIMWLLMKLAVSVRTDWRIVAIVLTLMYVLTNTYHTWSTYFAILGLATLILGVSRRTTKLAKSRSVALLVYAPVFWIFTAFYVGSGILFDRFVQALVAVRTLSPLENFLGPYFASGPLDEFLRIPPLWSPDRLSNLLAVALFVIALIVSSAILLKTVRTGTTDSLVGYGLSASLGSLSAIPALFALGGPNLALSRGLEFLSVTGPFVVGSAFVSLANPGFLKATDSKTNRRGSFRTPLHKVLTFLVLAFILANVTAAAVSLPGLPHDDELTVSEATAVKSLASVLGPDAVIWSDHRIATAFLYYEPHRFTTLELAYDPDVAPAATVAVFYGDDCRKTQALILGTGANVVVLTNYMRTEGIVQRAFPLNPSETVSRCLDRFASRFYDNGAVTAYSVFSQNLVAL